MLSFRHTTQTSKNVVDTTFKSLEEAGLLVKVVSEANKNERKKQKGGFRGMLLGTLGASLLGNLLTGKGTIRADEYIYQSKLDKTCFQHNIVYGDFTALTTRTAFDKILRDKAFNIP